MSGTIKRWWAAVSGTSKLSPPPAAAIENAGGLVRSPADLPLPPVNTLAALYLAELLESRANRTIMPQRCATELARLGWLASFYPCAHEPAFGGGFLVAWSIIAKRYPDADRVDPNTGRQCCQVLNEWIDDAFLAADR